MELSIYFTSIRICWRNFELSMIISKKIKADSTWIKYIRIFYEYFIKNFISFESKRLYKAAIILIYYFIII